MEAKVDPRTAIELRRIAREKRKKKKKIIYISALIVIIAIVTTIIAVSAANSRKEEELQKQQEIQAQKLEEQKEKEKNEMIATALESASIQAAGYDYDTAIETIKSVGSDYASYPELDSAVKDYEKAKGKLVRYEDPTTIPHVFFHSLIVDTDRAFDGDSDSDGYNLYMTTVYEFEQMLEEMYARGFVLVDIHDIAHIKTDENGNEKFVPGDIMLPEGKKPFVMSQDDVNYYEYMTDSDDDHFADAGGDGFATKIVIGEDGYPTCEYITAEGEVVTGDYDLVPILEKFIQAHPDFSYHGARAALGITGYEGVLGYRTHPDWEKILGTEQYQQEIENAKKVAQCLKDHGWTLASHSFGHPGYGNISAEKVAIDVQKWEDQVQPIIGDTDVFIYPYGNDIAGIEDYSGAKFESMYEAGYRYFCNVDSAQYWVQIHDTYVRQGRRNLDGYRLYWSPEKLEDLFDVDDVMDPNRPLPVPSM
jgi:hypothetical protein